MEWLRKRGGGTNRRPILKKDIEKAQTQTLSAADAARYLGVAYATYKKYAAIYGIHDRHLNRSGKGISKGSSAWKFPLDDILAGKHPSYDTNKLKKRLIQAGKLDEKCAICGLDERRVLDYKMPLMLVFKDGDRSNHDLENMMLLCFNHAFLTIGNLNFINPYSVLHPRLMDKKVQPEEQTTVGGENTLSPEEVQQIQAEVQSELPQ